MRIARTRFITIGAVVALLAVAAVVGTLLSGGSGGTDSEGTPAAGTPLRAVRDEFQLQDDSSDDLAFSAAVRAEPEGLTGLDSDGAVGQAVAGGDAAAAGAGGQPAPAGADAQALLDRKIIQSASIDLEVDEVSREFQEIVRIAETAGGFVQSSSFTNLDDQQLADVTIRVPALQYQAVLQDIRVRGDVTQESSDTNDATGEFTDLQARLRTLQATERRLLSLLDEAEGIGQILQVQDRLEVVRGQVEQVQGRINLLERLTDLATIAVHLRPVAPAIDPTPVDDGNTGPQPLEAAQNAYDHSLDALLGIATGLVVIAAFSWWLVPPVAVLGVGVRWWVNRRPRAAAQPSA